MNGSVPTASGFGRPPVVLLRASWQAVNIGDIAHTPGMLRLLERHVPEASVILWPARLELGVEELLRRHFPRLRIVRDVDTWRSPRPRPGDPTLAEAMAEADLMLHGSSADLGGRADLDTWHRITGKPYGAIGVTIGCRLPSLDETPWLPEEMRHTIEQAAFLFTRETRSLALLRENHLGPSPAFAPDATFAFDLLNETAAEKLMREAGLEADRFICVISRHRIAPYWNIYPERKMPPEEIAWRQRINDQWEDSDFRKLRDLVTHCVRHTGMKVLLCPEMTYQVELNRDLIRNRLPADVRPQVYSMDRYWLTDEAASIFRRARVIVSAECHSPIIAIAMGRPAIYMRQSQDTWKGRMFADLNLPDWMIEMDTAPSEEIINALQKIEKDYETARTRARGACALAARYLATATQALRSCLGLPDLPARPQNLVEK